MTLRNDHNTTFVQVIYRNVRKVSPCDHKFFSVFFITAPFLRGLGSLQDLCCRTIQDMKNFQKIPKKMLHPLLLYSFLCRRDASPMIYKYFFCYHLVFSFQLYDEIEVVQLHDSNNIFQGPFFSLSKLIFMDLSGYIFFWHTWPAQAFDVGYSAGPIRQGNIQM